MKTRDAAIIAGCLAFGFSSSEAGEYPTVNDTTKRIDLYDRLDVCIDNLGGKDAVVRNVVDNFLRWKYAIDDSCMEYNEGIEAHLKYKDHMNRYDELVTPIDSLGDVTDSSVLTFPETVELLLHGSKYVVHVIDEKDMEKRTLNHLIGVYFDTSEGDITPHRLEVAIPIPK